MNAPFLAVFQNKQALWMTDTGVACVPQRVLGHACLQGTPLFHNGRVKTAKCEVQGGIVEHLHNTRENTREAVFNTLQNNGEILNHKGEHKRDKL
jgi:hypothetical protein